MKTVEFLSPFWSDNGYRFCSCWYKIGYDFQGNHERVLRICLWSEIGSAFGELKGTIIPSYPSPPPPPLPPASRVRDFLKLGTIWHVILTFESVDELKAHGQCDHSNETPLAVLSHDSTICFSAFHTRYFCKFVFCQFNVRSAWCYTWPAAPAAACWEETKDTKGAVKVNQIHFTRHLKMYDG